MLSLSLDRFSERCPQKMRRLFCQQSSIEAVKALRETPGDQAGRRDASPMGRSLPELPRLIGMQPGVHSTHLGKKTSNQAAGTVGARDAGVGGLEPDALVAVEDLCPGDDMTAEIGECADHGVVCYRGGS